MDSYEATKIVFSRIQALDPENASKITGFVLIQEHGEQEMIRLAFGPESLLHGLILKAKARLCLSSNTLSTPCTPSSPSPFSPLSIPNNRPINPLSQHHHHSPILNPSFNIPSPLSANPNPNPPWHHFSGFSPNSSSSSPSSSPSYAAVVNGASNVCVSNSSSSSSTNSTNTTCTSSSTSDPFDEYNLQDHLSFLNDSSSSLSLSSSKKVDLLYDGNSNVLPYPNWVSESINNGDHNNTQIHHFHKRSLSLSDVCFGSSEDSGSGFGWKPCLYFARGFCKNGTSCKFVHSGGFGDSVDSPVVGSPNKVAAVGMFDHCQEMLRSKAAAQQQQQRLAAASQLMACGACFPYNKCMNFLMSDTQRSAAAALMMGDEFHKFGRYRPERNDFSAMGMGGNMNPGSRQIYLTFPADSTFREEDVSNYFSIYGPVQDVRIPYQQKRMFGFVTFVYPETVKLILSKGNPHFVCDSRVLVKPYKEKGKVPDKKQQHLERGEYSACSSPTGLDSREPYDLQLGARMFYNTQEMLLRRKLEQADLQQGIELQGRRLMNFQLMDLKNHHQHHQLHPYHHNLALETPTQPQNHGNQSPILPSDGMDQEVSEGNSGTPAAPTSPNDPADQQLEQEVIAAWSNDGNVNGSSEEESSKVEDCDLHESSLELILPDSLFASPKKSAGDHFSAFTSVEECDENNALCAATAASNSNTLLPTASTLKMAAKNSCSFHMPRFSSGSGAIEM